MAAREFKDRLELLEKQVAEIQATLGTSGAKKDWRRAVEKYAGDEDLLAVFAEAGKLRAAERKAVRRKHSRGPRP